MTLETAEKLNTGVKELGEGTKGAGGAPGYHDARHLEVKLEWRTSRLGRIRRLFMCESPLHIWLALLPSAYLPWGNLSIWSRVAGFCLSCLVSSSTAFGKNPSLSLSVCLSPIDSFVSLRHFSRGGNERQNGKNAITNGPRNERGAGQRNAAVHRRDSNNAMCIAFKKPRKGEFEAFNKSLAPDPKYVT